MADPESGVDMPEPERRVKMTSLVSDYFLNVYKQSTNRNIPVVKNALRRMPTVVKAENFMGNMQDALMQLSPEQMTGENCTFGSMKLRLVTDQGKQWGDVPVNKAMKMIFFKIALTQNTAIPNEAIRELNMVPFIQALYRGDHSPKTYTYALQIKT